MNIEKLNKLKSLIKAEIDLCSLDKTPVVCHMSEQPEDFANLENMIVDLVKQGSTIGGAIMEIERNYNINLLD